MRILAIETTTFTGSLALLDDGVVVAKQGLPLEQRSAQSLAPTIESLLAHHAWQPASLGLIAVAQGPGSFTGLRVGVTTAKTLAYALGAWVIGVDTLEVIAAQIAPDREMRVHAVVDAQRNQLFAATFGLSAGEFPMRQSPTRVIDLAAWQAMVLPGDVVTGPALAKLVGQHPAGVLIAATDLWEPRAAMVGRLAWRDYSAGRRDDLWKLAPQYHRESAAEEKARAKAAVVERGNR